MCSASATGENLPEPEGEPIAIKQRRHINFLDISKYVIKNYRHVGCSVSR